MTLVARMRIWEHRIQCRRRVRSMCALAVAGTAIALAAGVAIASPAGTTLLVSAPAGLGSPQPGAVNDSFGPAVASDDGRYVAFASQADGLTAGGASLSTQIFLRDTQTGTTTLVSRADGASGAAGNGDSREPAIAIDPAGLDPAGSHVLVAFATFASNLGDHDGANFADANGHEDVYVRDVTAGTTYAASVGSGTPGVTASQGNQDAAAPSIAVGAYGPMAAFVSTATTLGATNSGQQAQVYVRTLQSHNTELASCASASCGTQTGAAGDAGAPALRVVPGGSVLLAFDDDATSLTGDAGGHRQVVTGAGAAALGWTPTTFATVSRPDAHADTFGNAGSSAPSLNPDGTRVAFTSSATNLTADTVSGPNVYVRDLAAPLHTILASRATGAAGAVSDGTFAGGASIGGDATHTKVAFISNATNLGASGGRYSAWVRDLAASTTTLVDSHPASIALSGNGSRAVFVTSARDLADGGDPDFQRVEVRDLASGATSLASRPSGTAGTFTSGVNYSVAAQGATSADGRFVVFLSTSDSLSSQDDDTRVNVFERDTLTGTTTLVSRADGANGAAANGSSSPGGVSADGRFVAFASIAPNLGGPPNVVEIYVRDTQAKTTTLVSRSAGANGAPAADDALGGSISADGSRVVFTTDSAVGDAPADGYVHVFVRDLAAKTTTLVDRAAGAAGAVGQSDASTPAISADGRHVVFVTGAELDGAHTGVYERDLDTGTTTFVSRATGAAGAAANDSVEFPQADADGGRVVFDSIATNLSPSDTSPDSSVFERNVTAATTTLVSRSTEGADANGPAPSSPAVLSPGLEPVSGASIDAAGDRVAFESTATNLSPVATAGISEVYVRDLAANMTTVVSRGDGANGAAANVGFVPYLSTPGQFPGQISANGDCVAFVSASANLVPGVTGSDFPRIYERVLSRECPVVPPQTTITSGPTGTTTANAPTFTFTSSEAGSTFACHVDADGFAPCSSPHTTPALAEGAHTFTVRATDPAGYDDPSPAVAAFTVQRATRPVLSRLTVKFRRAHGKVRRSLIVRFKLSRAATVRIVIRRARTCHSRGAHPKRVTCRALRTVRVKAKAGSRSVRIDVHRLVHGRYVLSATPVDATGASGIRRTAKLTIPRGAR